MAHSKEILKYDPVKRAEAAVRKRTEQDAEISDPCLFSSSLPRLISPFEVIGTKFLSF